MWPVTVAVALIGCGSSGEGVPDEELGSLVHAEDTTPAPIDVDLAATDVGELARALALPHERVAALLGAHRFAGTAEMRVTRGGDQLEALVETAHIDFASADRYHAVYYNDADYGRDVYVADGSVYLRPRYGKFHRRPPADEAETTRVRDEIYATLGAHFELLAPRAELIDEGLTEIGGRRARTIVVDTAPSQRELGDEGDGPRAWRASREIESVQGEVVLDEETGVPLRAEIRGSFDYAHHDQDGAEVGTMHLEVKHSLGDIGGTIEITPPSADQTVATPERLREVDERNQLLEGIAPPAGARSQGGGSP